MVSFSRLYAAGDGFLHSWDERYHALVARNLMAHPLRPTLYEVPLLPYDPASWFANHVWLHKPPLSLWLMAGSMAVFGASELALRLPSLLLSTAGIYATYRIGASWSGEGVGLLAAFFHSINALLILLAAGWVATDHVDTAIVALVGLAVAAVAVGGPGARAFAGGASPDSPCSASRCPACWPCPWASPGTGAGRAPASCWRARAWRSRCASRSCCPGRSTQPRVSDRERAGARLHAAPSRRAAGRARGLGPLSPRAVAEDLRRADLPPAPLARLARRAGEREPPWRALAIWILLPFAVFSLSASKMPGYVMVAAPAVFLIQAACCAWLRAQWGGGRGRRFGIALALFGLLALPVRIVLDGLRLFRPYDRRPAWAEALRQLGTRLAGSRAVVFGSPHPIETMFYTSQTAYRSAPDRASVEALQARGYRVLVCDTPDLAPDGRGWPGVEYLTAGCAGP